MGTANVILFLVGFAAVFGVSWLAFVYPYGRVGLTPFWIGVGAGLIALVTIMALWNVAWGPQ